MYNAMMRTGKSIFLIFISLHILPACIASNPAYVATGYENSEDTEVAVIAGSGFIHIVKAKDETTGAYVDIYRVSEGAHDATKGPFFPSEFRLAPGNYCVFYASYSYITGSPIGMGCFDLKAGHKYRVEPYVKTHDYSQIWFKDMTTGEIISDLGWTGKKDFFNWCDRQDMVDESMKKYLHD